MIKGLNTAEIINLKKDDQEAVNKFYEYSAWTEDDYKKYEVLLNNLKSSYRSCSKKSNNKKVTKTKSKGDALEKIVNFIIEKSYFLEVYPNKRTGTNEIDQLIVISDYGKQTLDRYNISKKLLNFDGEFFLGECKNYDDQVGVTWIGKFNTLLRICGNCKFGVIFSYNGLAGSENKWEAAHGLTKIIYTLSDNNSKKYIIDFNISDFEKLKDKNINFFKILKAKKISLSTGCKSENLYEPYEGREELEKIYKDMLSNY